MKSKFTDFQAFSGEFSNAVVASFNALGGQLKNIFETGNVVVDAFVGSILDSLTALAEGFIRQLIFEKIFATGKKVVDAGKASSNAVVIATSAAAALGPVGAIALPGLIASQLAVVAGAFAGIQAFEHGGMVGGSSFSGDKLFARVNSGEMILNNRQQGNLSKMISPVSQMVDIVLGGQITADAGKLKFALDSYDNRKNRTR